MRTQSAKAKKVIAYIQANPSASYAVVAKKFKMSPSYVYKLRINTKLDKALKDGRLPLTKSSTKREAVDKVNHPPHYKVGGIETIDFIEAKSLNYNLGNVVKYLTRADYKGNKLEDLQKAQWYLARELKNLSK